jgi:hypothetical protein
LSKKTQPSSLHLIRVLKKRPPVAQLFPEIQKMEEMALRSGFRFASPRSPNTSPAKCRDIQ